jgi:hypothetical protein
MTLAEPTADSCNKIRQIRTSRPTQLMIGSTIIRNELALLIRSASPRILRLALALVRSTNPHFSAIDWIWAELIGCGSVAAPAQLEISHV